MPIRDPRPQLLDFSAQTASSAAAGRDTGVSVAGLVQGLEAFAGAARTVAAEREQIEARLEQVRAAKAEMDFTAGLETLLTEFDPAQPGALDNFNAEVAKRVADVTSSTNFKNDVDQQMFAARLEQLSARAAGEALKAAKRYGYAEAARLFGDHAGRLLNLIRNAPDSAGKLLAGAKEQTDRLLAAMEPAKRAAAEDELASAVVRAKIEGLAEKGQYNRARSLLASSEATVLDQGTRTALDRRIREIETVQRTEHLRATMQQFEDLELAVMQGKAGVKEIMDAANRGLFRGREGARNRLLALADRVQKQREKEQEEQRKKLEQAAQQQAENGKIPVASQNDADKLFAARYGGLENFPDEGKLLEAATTFAKETGYMPTALRSKVIAAEKAGDAASLAKYAALADLIAPALPGVELGAGPRIAMVRTLADALGGDYGRAAQKVASGELTPDKVKELEKQFVEDFKGIDFQELLEGVPGYQPTGEFRNAFTKALRTSYYLNGGDMELAKKQAAALLQQSGWGLTSFGGSDDPVLVKYPPEAHFPSLEGLPGSIAMRTVVDFEIGEHLKNVPGFENLEGRLPAYRLVADNATKAAIRTGRQPSWVVQVADPVLTGIFMPLTDVNGNAIRWTPPTDKDIPPELREKLKKLSAKTAKETFLEQNWFNLLFGFPSPSTIERYRELLRDSGN